MKRFNRLICLALPLLWIDPALANRPIIDPCHAATSDVGQENYDGNKSYGSVYEYVLAKLPMARELRNRIVGHLQVHDSAYHHAEFGAGPGLIGPLIWERNPNVMLYGFEKSPTMAAPAADNGFLPENYHMADLMKPYEWEAKLADNSLDSAAMNMVAYMMTFEENMAVFHVVAQKLKPGRRFVVSTLDGDGGHFLNMLSGELGEIGIKGENYDIVMNGNEDLVGKSNRHSPQDAQRWAEASGLRLLSSERIYHGFGWLHVFEKPGDQVLTSGTKPR